MPTPESTTMGKIVDAVQSVSAFSPTTALLLGIIIGACLGASAIFWLKRRHMELGLDKKE
jgi:uncharacterized OsmC-like protein